MDGTSTNGERGPFDVLLLESDPDDAAPLIDSFESTDATEAVHVVVDGGEALDFLHQREAHAGAPRPDIILLDLHISEPSGTEILTELNRRAELRRIPVLVLTTPATVEDVTESRELNANAYLRRPETSGEFVDLARAIENFWLEVAYLPPR